MGILWRLYCHCNLHWNNLFTFYALWFQKLDISAVVRSIGEARFAENSENKWHPGGDNLAALVAWSFILLSNIQSEKLERNQVSSSQQRWGITRHGPRRGTRTGNFLSEFCEDYIATAIYIEIICLPFGHEFAVVSPCIGCLPASKKYIKYIESFFSFFF